ncbi:hypothetical protein F7734_56410 [Scytonema sp. UIC 10036]|uniref:hypothetical protein n=1 Tax=Scytonema sp. UIC 10036 TaxID=2304196 RepID=UPI0012DA4F28|nr:hypothetical protein [Scytonema sp. UIC 10036]MUH01161.1 hypothetical protein [Scytonema sp. UIC 10036]
MQSIKVRSLVGSDGVLHLDIPVGMADKEVEVMVIYQPLESSPQQKTPEELGWPPDFFEQTAGALQDDPLIRYPQGEYEEREPLE